MGGYHAGADVKGGEGVTEKQTKRKLNIENLVTFILTWTVLTLGGILAGVIDFNIEGFLAGLAFIGILVFIGFLIDKSGLGKYFK